MAEQGPPAFSRARHPLALRLVLSHKSISEDFFVNRDEATPPAPLVRSPKASLASDPNGGSSPTTTEVRRPVLLGRNDPQGRRARFSLRGETRPKVLPIGRLSWFSTEGGKRTSVLKNHSFSCQKLCEAAGGRH